jgi:hypothetical protein
MRVARIPDKGREHRTTGRVPYPPVASFHMRDLEECIIVTIGLPDPDKLFRPSLYIHANARMGSPQSDCSRSLAFSDAFELPLRVVAKENRAIFSTDKIVASHSNTRRPGTADSSSPPSLERPRNGASVGHRDARACHQRWWTSGRIFSL